MIEKIVHRVEHFEMGVILEADTRDGKRHRYQLEELLGGGASSVVWKAKDLDLSDPKTVAIKALKPEAEREFFAKLDDEAEVLTALWNRENQKGYHHAVPQLFAVLENPPSLVMEWILFPSVTRKAGFILPVARIGFFAAQFNDFSKAVDEYTGQLRQFQSIPPKFWDVLEAYQKTQKTLKSDFQNLESEAAQWSQTVQQLSEKDLVEIGIQMCKLFALLHEERRSYADFQEKNFRWDEKTRQLKVLDWNVLAPPGEMDAVKDRVRLAGLLFYLICGKKVNENGASRRMLERWGDTLWQQNISLALRYVLARALSPDSGQRYQTDYQPATELLDLSQVPSLGGALEQISYGYTHELDQLVEQVGVWASRDQVDGAALLASIVRIRMKSESVSFELKEEFEKLEKSLLAKSENNSYFENGKLLLEKGVPAEASKEFRRVVDEDHEDLEAWRWWVLAESLTQVSQADFNTLWEEKYLVEGLEALKNGHWQKARASFVRIPRLLADAVLNENLHQAEQLAYELSLMAVSDARQEVVDRFKKILETIKAVQVDPDANIPYCDLLLKDWQQIRDWEKEADTYHDRMTERQTCYVKHERNL